MLMITSTFPGLPSGARVSEKAAAPPPLHGRPPRQLCDVTSRAPGCWPVIGPRRAGPRADWLSRRLATDASADFQPASGAPADVEMECGGRPGGRGGRGEGSFGEMRLMLFGLADVLRVIGDVI